MFEKGSDVIDVDEGTAIGTIVYTVRIQQLDPTTTSAFTSTDSGISVTPLSQEPRIELYKNNNPFELHVNNSEY